MFGTTHCLFTDKQGVKEAHNTCVHGTDF